MERIDRVRGTASYRRAAEWFARWPFWTLVASNIVVLPVDVPRLLAISTRYSRPRFVLATLVGRYPRYLLLAGLGYQLKPSNRQILAVLAALRGGLGPEEGIPTSAHGAARPGGRCRMNTLRSTIPAAGAPHRGVRVPAAAPPPPAEATQEAPAPVRAPPGRPRRPWPGQAAASRPRRC